MFTAEFLFLFKSRYNLFTLIITFALFYFLYYYYLDIQLNPRKGDTFYTNSLFIFFAFMYFYVVFRRLFSQNHIKFLAINFPQHKTIILKKVIIHSCFFGIIFIFTSTIFYLIFEKYAHFKDIFIVPQIVSYFIFLLFTASLSLLLLSFSSSIWGAFIILIYLFVEDFIPYLFKEYEHIDYFLFKMNYLKLVESFELNRFLILCFETLIILISIHFLNHKR